MDLINNLIRLRHHWLRGVLADDDAADLETRSEGGDVEGSSPLHTLHTLHTLKYLKMLGSLMRSPWFSMILSNRI